MNKEVLSSIPIEQLKNKLGQIDAAKERVEQKFGAIDPSDFSRRLSDLSLLDKTKPEDQIYALTRTGETRKKIAEVTIPYLEKARGEYEAEIGSRINDAETNLERLSNLNRDGYISNEELEQAENDLKALKSGFEVEPEPEKPEDTLGAPASHTKPKIIFDMFKRPNVVGIADEEGIIKKEMLPSLIEILRLYSESEEPEGMMAEKIAKAANAVVEEKNKKSAAEWMNDLKKFIEKDPANPQIVTSTGRNRGTRYQLHAEIVDPTKASEPSRDTESSDGTYVPANPENPDAHEFIIPDKEFYTRTDLVEISGQPASLIQPRISTYLQTDASISPQKRPGVKGFSFTREEFEILLKAVGSPKKRAYRSRAQKKKGELPSEISSTSADDLKGFNIPNQGYYSTEDLAAIVRQPLPLVRSRVQIALKKDKTINPIHLHDEKTNFFNRKDIEKLIRQVSGPKSRRGRRSAASESLQAGPTESSTSKQIEKKDKNLKPTELDLAKNRLKLDVARVLLSHFNARSIPTLSKRSMVFLKSCLPNGFDLKTIIGSELQEDVDNFVVDTFTDILEKSWNSKEEVSEIERQIIIDIEEIKAKGFDKTTIVRSVCKHFSIKMPEAYRKKLDPIIAGSRKKTKIALEQREDIFHVSATKKWNRRRPRAQRFPQHGGSLRGVIQPIIQKKAREAEKAIEAREANGK